MVDMNSFTTVIYTFKVSKTYNNWTVHEYKCLFLTSVFLQIEREREWYTKFGYKGLIDFVLFFYTGLKNLGSLVSQLFFCLITSAEGKGFPLPF